jgi:vitamin K-dependent gamma-carboxylase
LGGRAWRQLWARANHPVDAASLAAFRIGFGLIVAVAALRFLAHGWVDQLLGPDQFHFTYPGFAWVRPWPRPFLHLHFVALAVLGLLIAAGAFYRVVVLAFFCAFTYVELIDQTTYLNHYYLVSVLAGMMALLPLGRVASLDARRRRSLHLTQLPAWMLWALRVQIGLVYVYAGVAKLNADWLLRAQPLRIWLQACADLPLLGPWLAQPALAFGMSWAGALFDLTIVPLLLWARTRRVAFALVVGFHAATACLFRIGIFPWLMTLAASLFLAPDWPRRWLPARPDPAPHPGGHPPIPPPGARLVPAVLALHLLVQLALPLRQHFLPGASAWTQQGFNFAWNVMVAEKSGTVTFVVTDAACGHHLRVRPESLLSPTQTAMMAQDPALIRALGRHLAARAAAAGHAHVSVRVEAYAALNGHRARPLVDPAEELGPYSPAGS